MSATNFVYREIIQFLRQTILIIEGDVFRIIVPLDENLTGETPTQSTTQSTTRLAVDASEKMILELIGKEPTISQKEIACQLRMNINIGRRTYA